MALRWDADGPARLPRDGGGGPGAVGDGAGSELPLLTSAQMAEFVANGMLVLRLQLPDPWLRDFYDKAQQLVESGADRSAMWEAIDPQVNAITADPVLRGAFTSILGEDYLMPPNGTLHSRGPGADQAFHKVRLALSLRRPLSHRPAPCSCPSPSPIATHPHSPIPPRAPTPRCCAGHRTARTTGPSKTPCATTGCAASSPLSIRSRPRSRWGRRDLPPHSPRPHHHNPG